MNYRYEIDIKPVSEEHGGGYMAVVPDLPGCKSDGATREEALQNAYDAIDCGLRPPKKWVVQYPNRA